MWGFEEIGVDPQIDAAHRTSLTHFRSALGAAVPKTAISPLPQGRFSLLLSLLVFYERAKRRSNLPAERGGERCTCNIGTAITQKRSIWNPW